MQPKTDKILFYTILLLSFFTVVFIYLNAEATYDAGDGIVHYVIARYSWKHPYLLLYLWGKPFFTLVSSPFAQFGLKGMAIFQALNAAAISLLLFSISAKIKLKYTWSIPVFVFFAPVYFAVMNSGLAEIFFGTVFILSVWLVFNKRYYLSAFVASFIPFVRPEAYVVIPLLLMVYVYRRHLLAIPLLFTATLIYTFAGYSYYKDIFWIITQNYKLVGDNYAGAGMKGSYFHYFQEQNQIWGTAYTILLLIGIGIILYQAYSLLRRKPAHNYVAEVFLLFLGSTVGCFVLHSLLCGMPGILNNLGMIRYLSVLIPGSAIIAVIGLNQLNISFLNKFRYLNPVIIITFLFIIVLSVFSHWYYPFNPSNEQLVMKQMGIYMQKSVPGLKIYYQHPLLPLVANADPFDNKKVEMLYSSEREYVDHLPDSALVLWESHFMKGDANIPLSLFTGNPNFVLLKHYKFFNEDLPFEAYLFMRNSGNKLSTDSVPAEFVSLNGLVSGMLKTGSVEYTFENDTSAFSQWLALRSSVSGKNVMGLTSEREFGPVFTKKSGELGLNGLLNSVTLKFKILQGDTLKEMITVIEIKDNGKLISWAGLTSDKPVIPNEWNSVEFHHSFAEPVTGNDMDVNIYFWNKEKQTFYIDEFNITFSGRK